MPLGYIPYQLFFLFFSPFQHDGRFNVTWEYNGDVGNQSTDTEPFKPDFFLVLTRPVLRSVSQLSSAGPTSGNADAKDAEKGRGSEMAVKNDATVHYGRYRATQVNGSDARVRNDR